MSRINMSFSIQGDEDGYIIFECPFCESEFKLKANEVQSTENPFSTLYCPYCGLNDEISHFYSKEVIQHARELAKNYAIDELNKAFKGMSQKMNKSNVIKMEFKPLKKVTLKTLETKETVEEEFTCTYCDNHIKILYSAGASMAFCSYCGVTI